MHFKDLSTSTKKYVILLVVSVVVLLIAEALTFKQIGLLEDSAEEVAHTQEVQMTINNLYSHYTHMETEELANLLLGEEVRDSSWEDFKEPAFYSFKNLEILINDNVPQKRRLKEIGRLQNSYYDALHKLRTFNRDTSLINNERKKVVWTISLTLDSIRNTKNEMLLAENRLMTQRKEDMNTRAARAPLFTLLIALFALCVFLLAFARIYRNKQRIKASEEFLQNILRNTTNIVNYYEPVYDESGKVIDFAIAFANECNRTYLGLDPEKIVGKRMSVIFPHLILNDELNKLIEGYEKQEIIHFDRPISALGKKMWFKSTIVPHANGLLATGVNVTRAKEDEEKLKDLNERLRNQNEELVRAEAFLEGILRSTKNVIMTFEPIWDNEGSIVDFKLLFINLLVEGIVRTNSGNPVGITVSEISPFIYQTEIFRRMVQCYTEDKPVEFETSYKEAAGIEHWVQGTAIKWHQLITLNLVDISKLMQAEHSLRRRNLQLKRSNEELESFNRVASHDLQEPLRKIQMFLSRFFDADQKKVSAKGLDYLNKVQKAAERMQSLIVNLLAYSKIDGTHENFEPVDLNQILAKIKDDLAIPIKESGAKIKSDTLPTVNGLPFQMEQLFSNLISNALKYRKPDTRTRIVIRVEDVHRKQIREDFIKTSRNYYKISVLDNGIGFDVRNAAKIFEVFQRLHQKTEYSGTGIGLAICKKIVENHLGYITATAEQGEGATFIIYFPHH